jgi:AcrR family transcriptional regulator
MPKGFTEKEKELIRGRLLEQGHRLFSAYGLKKTNIEELAKAAGISKGAFYLFYESKEALFLDVAELVEKRFRQEILSAIELPGPSPRARMLAVLKKAFSLFRTIPILQSSTGSDYDLLFRRIPIEKLQAHLDNDRVFFEELIKRCREAGIPIQPRVDEIRAMLYALVLAVLHEDDLGPNRFEGTVDILMELVAAYCVGEIEIQVKEPVSSIHH